MNTFYSQEEQHRLEGSGFTPHLQPSKSVNQSWEGYVNQQKIIHAWTPQPLPEAGLQLRSYYSAVFKLSTLLNKMQPDLTVIEYK